MNLNVEKKIKSEDNFLFIDLLYKREISIDWKTIFFTDNAKKIIKQKWVIKSINELWNIFNEYILSWKEAELYTWFNNVYLNQWYMWKESMYENFFDNFIYLNKEILEEKDLKTKEIKYKKELTEILNISYSLMYNYKKYRKIKFSDINIHNYILTSDELSELCNNILNTISFIDNRYLEDNKINSLFNSLIELFFTSNNENNIRSFDCKDIVSEIIYDDATMSELLISFFEIIDVKKDINIDLLKKIDKSLLYEKKLLKNKYSNLEWKEWIHWILSDDNINKIYNTLETIKKTNNISVNVENNDDDNVTLEEKKVSLYKRIHEIEKDVKNKILWQDTIISEIIQNNIKKLLLWINSRPLSFVFAWQSWTWKTETAKTLAKNLDTKLLHIPMWNFNSDHTAHTLLGAPMWYARSEEKTLLEKYIIECNDEKRIPIILFDEIEKWHRSLQNMYLEMFDEWKITFLNWEQYNIKDSIIIMTSNLGVEKETSVWFNVFDICEQEDKDKENVFNELSLFFRQEILNRISDIFIYKELSKYTVDKIIDNIISDKINKFEKNNIIKDIFWDKILQLNNGIIKKEIKKEVDDLNIDNIRKIESISEKSILYLLENYHEWS